MEFVKTERGNQDVIELPDYYKHVGRYNSDAAWGGNSPQEPTVDERLAQLEQRVAALEARP